MIGVVVGAADLREVIAPRHVVTAHEVTLVERLPILVVEAIRELVLLPDFKEDPEWIAKKLSPPITPRRAKAALEVLQDLGFLKRDEKSGRLIQSERNITTDREVVSLAIANFHRQMMQQASESIERTRAAKRDISSLTLALFIRMDIYLIRFQSLSHRPGVCFKTFGAGQRLSSPTQLFQSCIVDINHIGVLDKISHRERRAKPRRAAGR